MAAHTAANHPAQPTGIPIHSSQLPPHSERPKRSNLHGCAEKSCLHAGQLLRELIAALQHRTGLFSLCSLTGAGIYNTSGNSFSIFSSADPEGNCHCHEILHQLKRSCLCWETSLDTHLCSAIKNYISQICKHKKQSLTVWKMHSEHMRHFRLLL